MNWKSTGGKKKAANTVFGSMARALKRCESMELPSGTLVVAASSPKRPQRGLHFRNIQLGTH